MDTIQIPIPSDEIIHVAVYDKDGKYVDPTYMHYKVKIRVNKQVLNFEYFGKDDSRNSNCLIETVTNDFVETNQLACYINGNTIKKPGLIEIAICRCEENNLFNDGVKDVWTPYEYTNLEYIEL